MRNLTFLVAAIMMGTALGCARPAKLRIESPTIQSAHLRTSLAQGKAAATPGECETPCEISIPPDTEQHIRLDAAGYYPAILRIGYMQVQALTAGAQGADAILRVPLIRAPEEPRAGETPPAAPPPEALEGE